MHNSDISRKHQSVMMLFLRLKEALAWQIVFLSLRVILWWGSIRGHRFSSSEVDLSANNLVEICGIKKIFVAQTKQKFFRHVFLEKMFVKFANKLVKPFTSFPFSFVRMQRDLRNYYDFPSLIILVYHVSGFTLLIDLISVAILDDTNKNIVILYGLANIDWVNKIRSTWIQSEKLHFILNDSRGMLSLRDRLKQETIIFALIDIPQHETNSNSLVIDFINRTICFKIGVLRLAAVFNIPILPIVHHLNHAGIVCRFYPIVKLSKKEVGEPEKLKNRLGEFLVPLSEIIQKYPEQWFLWHKIPLQ